ncbi:MAG TPA: CHAT domain-containing protein [Candidatus Obscuribacterales bacterium]
MGKKPINLANKRAAMEKHGEQGWKALQGGDFAKAASSYEKAVELARAVCDHGAEAVFSSYLGIARQSTGEFEAAKQHFRNAAEIAKSYGLSKVESHARLLLAEQERDEGHSDQSIEGFLKALDAAYTCGDVAGMEIAFGNLGRLYLEKGWAEQAFEAFRHALEVKEDTPNKAAWLGSLGLASAELGQLDEAIDYYIRAFNEAALSDDRKAQAICRGSKGNALFEAKRFDEAAQCYEDALKLSDAAGDQRRSAIWLGNIGNTWLKKGDVGRAIECCTKAVELAHKHSDRQSEAAHLDSLGDCYFAQGNLNMALEKYTQAFEISTSIEDRQGQRIYLSNLGKVHQQMGQLQPAFDFFSSAIDLFDEQRSSIRADDLKTSFANRGQELYRDMIKVCISMGRRVEALEYVGRAKSRALLDLLSNSPIDITQLLDEDDESLKRLIEREADLRNKIAYFERLFWQGPPASESGHRGVALQPDDTQRIYAEWRQVVNQLRRRHPNYASLVCASTLSFDEINALWAQQAGEERSNDTAQQAGDKRSNDTAQQAEDEDSNDAARRQSDAASDRSRPHLLNRNTAIVEFYWTDQYLMAASLRYGARQPQLHYVTDPEILEALELDLSNFLEMSATEGWEVPVSLCKRLYEKLLGPVLDDIPENITHLLMIPHGSLYHLPFSALNDGKSFMCERFAISYLPTTSLVPVLAQADGQSTASRDEPAKYLVSAISDYSITRKEGLVLSSRLRSAAGLDDLSYTLEEAQTVFDLGRQTSSDARLLTNQEVKEAFPSLFSEYPVVHFAGHAVFNPEEPLASGLVLADGTILTAAAILQGNVLRTRCGKLLVLSACQTGVSKVTAGGEILGLARALMYAGMPNLVLSLWEVADRSTATFMKDFHSAWQGGRVPIYEALRTAQTQALKNGHPVHAWAPFVHMGID